MGYLGYDFEGTQLVLGTIGFSLKKGLITPWKINMEPTNHPFRKENDLPNLHDYVPC